MKPTVRIDSFKLEFCLHDALDKIAFLGKISQSEDNSSELAGFEINKLMREQTKLEADYAKLIKTRSNLKGISNREEHKKVEDEISSVSRSLKENTKKLCRLFKENTNLDNDNEKVQKERVELMDRLGRLLDDIQKNNLDKFIDTLILELGDQNKLADLMKKDKELNLKIKETRTKIAEETKEYEDLKKEKRSTIHSLKNEVSKAQTQTHAKLKYEKKVIETRLATNKRINTQKLREIQKEKDEVADLQRREEAVYNKMSNFFETEKDQYDHKFSELDNLRREKEREMKREKFKLDIDIKRNREIIEKFKKQIEEEKQIKAAEQDRINAQLKAREDADLKNKIIDEKMMIIQQQFEEWMRLVGPKKKAAAKPKK